MNIAVPAQTKGTRRRQEILDMALELANEQGFSKFTSVELAKALGCSWGVIFHYFGTMDLLRNAVMCLAVDQRNTKVILDGLIIKNPVALEAPDELKDLAKSLLD